MTKENEKLSNIKVLTPKQRRAVLLIAEGFSHTEVSKYTGYTIEHLSRLMTWELVKEELSRLRAEAELRLAKSLPEIVDSSLGILKGELSHPNANRRAEAAKFVLRFVLKPFWERLASQPKEMELLLNKLQFFNTTNGD